MIRGPFALTYLHVPVAQRRGRRLPFEWNFGLDCMFSWVTSAQTTSQSPPQVSNLPRADIGVEKKRRVISKTACPKTTDLFHPTLQTRVDAGEHVHTHTCPYPGCETRSSRQDDFLYQCAFSLVPTRKFCGSLVLLAAALFLMASPMN